MSTDTAVLLCCVVLKVKESSTQTGISVRWDVGLNRKKLAIFRLSRVDDADLRLVAGDELSLKYVGGERDEWVGLGNVVKIGLLDEITLELRSAAGAPVDQTTGFCVDFVWYEHSLTQRHSRR